MSSTEASSRPLSTSFCTIAFSPIMSMDAISSPAAVKMSIASYARQKSRYDLGDTVGSLAVLHHSACLVIKYFVSSWLFESKKVFKKLGATTHWSQLTLARSNMRKSINISIALRR